MKVLMVHNFYGSSAPSGENLVFEAEKNLLRAHGHDVAEFTRHSDEIRAQGAIGAVRGAVATPWNPWMARAVRRMVERFRPDVVHVHNTFPLLSPGIFRAIGHRAARILTLHNYRLFCPAAIPMRDGRVCTDCLERRSAWPAMRHGCYRGSGLATLPLAVNVELHRALGTWTRQVDGFIALSDFQRSMLTASGLPDAKVHVKPNFYPGRPAVLPWPERAPYVVFAGRLGREKGVETLLRAWRLWGPQAPELRLAGDGELRPDLERMAEGFPVRFLGQVPGAEAQAQIAGAWLLVLPSECFEGFPMVVREAFAFGTPVAVSDLGPLPSIVQEGVSGVMFPAASAEALLKKVRAAWETPGLLPRLGQGARAEFEEKYTEAANYQMLMSIYEAALEINRGGGRSERTGN
jgi:glycosyltransferase involved in cell wall biosynthesis